MASAKVQLSPASSTLTAPSQQRMVTIKEVESKELEEKEQEKEETAKKETEVPMIVEEAQKEKKFAESGSRKRPRG